MNEFLIDCSFKQCSMALKFDLFDPALCNFDPALCCIARELSVEIFPADPALCGIAQDQSSAMRHSAGQWSHALLA
jgi:hypothetical protein